MLSEVRQNKVMEKLNRAQKCSILGDQNLWLMSQGLLGICCWIETRDRIERITLTAALFD